MPNVWLGAHRWLPVDLWRQVLGVIFLAFASVAIGSEGHTANVRILKSITAAFAIVIGVLLFARGLDYDFKMGFPRP